MRKQTKLVAVLSAAALLAIGASMTSFAAKGWTQEDGQWYYYDNSGDYVTDSWKKSGNNYFYLGDEGYMLTNSLIQDGDNYYYVDANGAMVKNQWVQIEADDSEVQDVEYRWYRFGATGRALRATNNEVQKKTVNGKKYAFDTEGKMLFGFVDENAEIVNQNENPVLDSMYYFGSNEDGAMYTGWLNYTEGVDDEKYDGKDSLWFYYNPTTGEKVYNEKASVDYKDKRIGKYSYSFDENGVMASGWNKASSGDAATESRYFSADDQGWMQKNTWVWAVPSKDIDVDDHGNDTYRWFYVGSDGEIESDSAKRINSKWYIFDDKGRMQSGLVVLNESKISSKAEIVKQGDDYTVDTSDVEGSDIISSAAYSNLFYFGDEETDGSMKTGSNFRIELADDVYTFSFEKTGQASHGKSKNNKLYINGILQTAGDMRYQAVSFADDSKVYVVGSTGTVVKTKQSVKDADDNYYAVRDEKVYFVEAGDEASKIARFIATSKAGDKIDLEVGDNKDLTFVLDMDEVAELTVKGNGVLNPEDFE